ncbi:MAG: EF-hand domain-containing protein [Alphaproteobacteria bacterium]
MFSRFVILILLCLPVFASNAQACHSTPEQRREDFDWLDADKDGLLTRSEYFSHIHPIITIDEIQERFAEVDTDEDGKVNFDEFSAMKQKQRC